MHCRYLPWTAWTFRCIVGRCELGTRFFSTASSALLLSVIQLKIVLLRKWLYNDPNKYLDILFTLKIIWFQSYITFSEPLLTQMYFNQVVSRWVLLYVRSWIQNNTSAYYSHYFYHFSGALEIKIPFIFSIGKLIFNHNFKEMFKDRPMESNDDVNRW